MEIRVYAFNAFTCEEEHYKPEIYGDDIEFGYYNLYSGIVAELLNIPYNKYKELLIKYGAVFDYLRNQDYYFNTYQECEQFVECDELLAYLKNNSPIKFGMVRKIDIIENNVL